MNLNGKKNVLRYGENPHQEGIFYGNLEEVFTQLNGKELSYNNLVDIDSAIHLIEEFDEQTFAILKHTNACGIASDDFLLKAWKKALDGDPVSAFGGVLITNAIIDVETAIEINKIFFEVLLAPGYEDEALEILKSKKNRILLEKKSYNFPSKLYKTLLNGVIEQDKDLKTVKHEMKPVTIAYPTDEQVEDLLFANKVVKHTKSNTIVLVKNKQLYASGVGRTSRVDALKQAIEKATNFGFDLDGCVLASDAFFPFPDVVEISSEVGIKSIIQPGGSIKDKDSIKSCDKNKISMIFTSIRHFKH